MEGMDITLKDLSIGYSARDRISSGRTSGRVLVENANATFVAGSLIALVGRNGTGKSTLLRVMAGLARPLSGSVFVGGTDLASMSAHSLARTVGFVSTERIRVANLRARDVVALGRTPYTDWIGRLTPEDDAAVDSALALVGMSAHASSPLDTLSDGEAQRVMIARVVAQDTPVVLLDEPTAFLDFVARREVCELLGRLARERGRTVVFSSHELSLVDEFADHRLTLAGGGKIFFQ